MKRATGRRADPSCRVGISIHALVKRATPDSWVALNGVDISIHALVKRATH